jgi:hypothetical protein
LMFIIDCCASACFTTTTTWCHCFMYTTIGFWFSLFFEIKFFTFNLEKKKT